MTLRWQSEWNDQKYKLTFVKTILKEWHSTRHIKRFYGSVDCELDTHVSLAVTPLLERMSVCNGPGRVGGTACFNNLSKNVSPIIELLFQAS